jgi:hypothetical protein
LFLGSAVPRVTPTSRTASLAISPRGLIRPATQLRRAGPYETSRGNAENFPTAPPAHTLLSPGAPSISFAPIVRARHLLERADRFANLGYGSVFRLKPFRPHLTMGALSCTNGQHDTETTGHRATPPTSAQRGITPAFGYGPRLGPVRLDFHQLVLCAARRTLWPPPTPSRRDRPLPGSSPVIGRRRSTGSAACFGRGGPPQFPPSLSERSVPPTPGSSPRLRSRIFTASVAFTLIEGARLSLFPPCGRHFNGAAGFASCSGPPSCSPFSGLSTVRFDPGRFPPAPATCYRASWQLPGPDSHRQATTSFRPRHGPTGHLPISGRTQLNGVTGVFDQATSGPRTGDRRR